ncbi:DUF6916 family protein [Allorhizobium taibaishanense]|uniref:DUF6916 domain-containing protein n=1 Tax=Allorhizobium taibaishanense TaxID=887144 RepID=A0A1Q8ZYN3_9HYPH|nr:hypothetical protein [Allorhizobium taibaishanense]MBB4008170.1 hypothetical protein [Allorhizobium taibaishanense]OLP47165.1 hypothetical protein BJF91_10770 [Allorhizobium taibaishanense]
MSISILNAGHLRPFVGTSFNLINEGGTSRVLLDKVIEYPASTAPGSSRTAFSMFFSLQKSESAQIESGHFAIEHDDLETIALVYIERILGSRPDKIRLEAAFN